MSNETIRKFGYPGTLIREYDRWVILLRPAQVTVGSLVLASKEDVQRFSDLSRDAFSELKTVTGQLENALAGAFRYDKLNYLMLMMVDPYVHYHVVPRYSAPVELEGRALPDERWPGPPDVTAALDLNDGELAAIKRKVSENWPT